MRFSKFFKNVFPLFSSLGVFDPVARAKELEEAKGPASARMESPERSDPLARGALDAVDGLVKRMRTLEEVNKKTFQRDPIVDEFLPVGSAMDSSSVKQRFQVNGGAIPLPLLEWYSSYGFISFQVCALLAQHWLIAKACMEPAKDATRNGYDVTVNDGSEVSAEVLDAIRHEDVRYNINKNLIEFVQMGRVFGIRIAIFKVDSDDPKYYEKPFNPDGIKPGSYRGISQVDPYWITPQLDAEAAGDPASIHFYEPTWWMVNGILYHSTHLVIFRTEEVADVLKPTYLYAGVSIPQKIMERVYAAERTANEAPLLSLSKRTKVIKTDITQALANQEIFDIKAQQMTERQNNYGTLFLGLQDDYLQTDTSLADLDAVIMTQYQIVAAAANMPATKLLGTTPKGFNSTGEFEEASYHEELETIQTHDLTQLLNRHHLLLIRSEIAPRFNIEPFETTIEWHPLDAMTAKEQAELNKLEADTGAVLAQVGAIDGTDERQRIINDPKSGYSGLATEELPDEDESEIPSDLTGA